MKNPPALDPAAAPAPAEAGIRRQRSAWREAVLVCGKCSRKLDGGFGRKQKAGLAKALRKELDLGKGRRARAGVVEMGCLGLCPKDAVTVVRGSQPGTLYVVPRGADLDAVAATLGLSAKPGPGED
ncbi:hypothetical protein [Zavarzinia sp. CC-PAN008]|uniref:hypothetical protein n=1 Tax=Zavarzinia sp. CC-PAN008 TaxID=3243332 RepID=UPI003F746080